MAKRDAACQILNGALVLLSGVAFLLFGLKSIDASSAHVAAGFLITLHGISHIAHATDKCPVCRKA